MGVLQVQGIHMFMLRLKQSHKGRWDARQQQARGLMTEHHAQPCRPCIATLRTCILPWCDMQQKQQQAAIAVVTWHRPMPRRSSGPSSAYAVYYTPWPRQHYSTYSVGLTPLLLQVHSHSPASTAVKRSRSSQMSSRVHQTIEATSEGVDARAGTSQQSS